MRIQISKAAFTSQSFPYESHEHESDVTRCSSCLAQEQYST